MAERTCKQMPVMLKVIALILFMSFPSLTPGSWVADGMAQESAKDQR
jgi:hypothetical protein